MRQREDRRHAARTALALLLAAALACPALLAGCTQGGEEEDAEQTADVVQEAEDAFVAHGSEYGKSETVSVSSSLAGDVESVSVTEWLKNPDELAVIEDESNLQGILADDDVAYTQDGESIAWQADGADVSYTGLSDEELPFALSYTYTLDGEEVQADELDGVTGTLEVTIGYENLTSETVEVDGCSVDVQIPYLMASVIMFDSEYARDVGVSSGTVVETQGTTVAAGVALPGLAATLGLDELDAEQLGLDADITLPEEVTIRAEVTGFTLESIITVATDQVLSAFTGEGADDASTTLADAFAQLDDVLASLETLDEGMEGVSEAIATIDSGVSALNEAFPNATDGLEALGTLSAGVGEALDASGQAVSTSLAAQAAALEQLQAIDTSTLADEQAAAIEAAIESLQAAQAADTAAATGLAGASAASGQLTDGLGSVGEGLAQIQEGYGQLGEALGTVSTATDTLSGAVSTMSAAVIEGIDGLQLALEDKLELVGAIAELVEERGAWGGSADDMPSSTLFIVTASAA